MTIESIEKPFCSACGGHHDEDSDNSWVDFRNYRFRKPFRCICCGKEICMRQFAFGRACGPCDVGACDIHNRAYNIKAVHTHPVWWDSDASEMFRMFVEAQAATPTPLTGDNG